MFFLAVAQISHLVCQMLDMSMTNLVKYHETYQIIHEIGECNVIYLILYSPLPQHTISVQEFCTQ